MSRPTVKVKLLSTEQLEGLQLYNGVLTRLVVLTNAVLLLSKEDLVQGSARLQMPTKQHLGPHTK